MFSNMTLREEQVLSELALGYSNKQIGEKLFISEATVKMCIQKILRKLNVKNRIQAAVIAASYFHITPEDIVKAAALQRGE